MTSHYDVTTHDWRMVCCLWLDVLFRISLGVWLRLFSTRLFRFLLGEMYRLLIAWNYFIDISVKWIPLCELRSSYGFVNRYLLILDHVARDIFGHVIDVICMVSIAFQHSFNTRHRLSRITDIDYRFCNWALKLVFSFRLVKWKRRWFYCRQTTYFSISSKWFSMRVSRMGPSSSPPILGALENIV